MSERLRVDPIACDGHGLCAELVPELIRLDEWGFPILSPEPVPPRLARHVKRAIGACPVLALRLERLEAGRGAPGAVRTGVREGAGRKSPPTEEGRVLRPQRTSRR